MSTSSVTRETRTTRQRSAVLAALRQAPEPLSAQDLHAGLGRRVGLATLYRLCNPLHHHHLVCERCGRVEEIDACEVQPWAERAARRRGFAITGHQADIFGLCPNCQAPPS